MKDIIINEGSSENVLLQKFDKVEIFRKELFLESFKVSIDGSVKLPTKMEFSDGMTLNDLIFTLED